MLASANSMPSAACAAGSQKASSEPSQKQRKNRRITQETEQRRGKKVDR
jgi:ribosomal protein L12E/L44/L45/RPP1/RPP2